MSQLEEGINKSLPSSTLKRFLKPLALTIAAAGVIIVPTYLGAKIIDKYNLDASNIIYFATPGLITTVGVIAYLLHQPGPRMNEYIPSKNNKRSPLKSNYEARNF